MTRWLPPLLLVLLSACGAAQVSLPARRPPLALSPRNDLMRIHFIDVGQGLAALVEFPCGAMLIDAGGEDNPGADSNERLQAYLDAFFVRRTDLNRTLDLLALTHPHIDHTRGVSLLLEHFRIKSAIDNGMDRGSGGTQQGELHLFAAEHKTGKNAMAYRAIGLEDVHDASGLRDAIIDPIRCVDIDPQIHVLWGQIATDPGWPGMRFGKTPFQNANNHSLVLRVDFGKASALFTGDLEEAALHDLVARTASTHSLDVDIYQVGHHGSRNGTTPELVAAMTPEIAVIPMGEERRHAQWSAWKYGHPRQEIVAMLEAGMQRKRRPTRVQVGVASEKFVWRALDAAIYGTGWDGTVVVEAQADGRMHVVTQAQALSRP